MDTACLQYRLTEAECTAFERDGYFVVEDAIPMHLVEQLLPVVDRLDAQYRPQMGLGPYDSMNLLDFIGKDELFLELLDWPKTFAKVWDILGWNIQLYHSHLIISPPNPAGPELLKRRLGWHQDSGRLNRELETTPQPRISLKVAFFLTDTTELGRSNMYVVPGSQHQNHLDYPADGVSNPEGAVALRIKAGSAVFFDRRIWHASSPNASNVARKVLFYGYSYRWLRPRDDMTVAHMLERSDPIRRQLLGASATGGHGYSSPKDEDVPLRTWIREHVGEAAVTP